MIWKALRSSSGPRAAARGWIDASTGLVEGEDYEVITANLQTGFQAFLCGTNDVQTNGCLGPGSQHIQFTETQDVRFFGPGISEQTCFLHAFC